MKPNVKRKQKLAAAMTTLALLASPAFAHDLWLMPQQSVITVGQPISIRAVFGHNYPEGSVLPGAQYTTMSLLAPNGEKSALRYTESGIYQTTQFTPKTAGQYLVKCDYISFYAHGAPRAKMLYSKDQLQGEKYFYCKHVFQCAKAIIGSGETALKPTGQTIELVPQKNTASLKVGDLLPVKALWKGKPIEIPPGQEVDIKAAYAGFQQDEDTFAFLGHSNKDGVCRVQITHPGWWMVMVEHTVPAADKTKADLDGYVGTLVFYVAPDGRQSAKPRE